MEKIDFSPFQGQMNHMAFQLALLLFVPLIAGLVVKFVLRSIRLSNKISNIFAICVFWFVFYKMIFIVLG
jgi:hypothetical protein